MDFKLPGFEVEWSDNPKGCAGEGAIGIYMKGELHNVQTGLAAIFLTTTETDRTQWVVSVRMVVSARREHADSITPSHRQLSIQSSLSNALRQFIRAHQHSYSSTNSIYTVRTMVAFDASIPSLVHLAR